MDAFDSDFRATTRRPAGRRWLLPATIAAGSALLAGSVARRYRGDLRAAYDRLAAMDRRAVPTPWGSVEYAERAGAGEPLLAIHGIFQGCDGGLLTVRDQFPDRRVIAPSRFGYHGSSMPAGATPAAQADAFAALLDALQIGEVDVIGISAGSTSALQFAMRHPDRARRLVVLSGNLPGGRTAVVQPAWARALYGDVPMWAIRTLSPRTMTFLAGVPRGFSLDTEDARFVDEFVDTIFPIASKIEGVKFDAFVSNPDVNGYELESIRVPALLVHAMDDPLASYDAAERAAARIRGARLVSLESGGHLMVGQAERVRAEIADFLTQRAAA